jgi:hypothetical protein
MTEWRDIVQIVVNQFHLTRVQPQDQVMNRLTTDH